MSKTFQLLIFLLSRKEQTFFFVAEVYLTNFHIQIKRMHQKIIIVSNWNKPNQHSLIFKKYKDETAVERKKTFLIPFFLQNYILNITLHTQVQPSVQKNLVQNSFKPTYYHPAMKINSHLKKAITFFLFSNEIIVQNNHVLFPHNHWHFTALVIPKAKVWGSNICCCSSMPHRTYILLHTNEMSLADHLNSFLLLHKSQQ